MERDWLDYAGFAFNILATAAGLFGLFLAIRAYRIGVKAYEVSAESYKVAKDQGRKTFELEIMRELVAGLDQVILSDSRDSRNPSLPAIGPLMFSRLPLLPKGELSLWRMVDRHREADDSLEDIRANEAVRGFMRNASEDEFVLALGNALYQEIHEAMRRRTE